ncbi:MAG: phosphatase PAP2 family protein [Bacteroidetes bacterium]|nr:MAG: phosphatase PAP2 family protein [Bacteroidota bacterium]
MQKVSDVIVHDIFSPPVASRIYAYTAIAGYEALQNGYPEYLSLEGQLHDLKDVPKPDPNQEYCYPLASAEAMLTVGKALIFSEDMVEDFRQEILAEFQGIQMPKAVYDASLAYGDAIAKHILDWADKDMYKETRTYPKFSITDDPARWKPTPPDYMDGIEPHWNKIRPFVIDSAQQFKPAPPTPFSVDKNSQFYKETMEVYTALDVEKEERAKRELIASFWDCNPYVSHHQGHVMFATKKITPGGHWIGICQAACKQANADIMKSAEAYVWTSVALADAFISCWDEKYRSNLVRPETVINTYIDEEWKPFLQTPPFPEYTSGHSVISRAAAVALTHIFGDNFSFNDPVEVVYGLPNRTFDSFLKASEEAAISRLYGGIHYRPACFIGVKQGEKVSNYIISKLKTRKGQVSMK